MTTISTAVLHTREYASLFNQRFFSAAEVADLVADDGRKLFLRSDPVADDGVVETVRVQIDGAGFTARRFRGEARGWRRWLGGRAYRRYRSSERLLRAEFNTAAPVIAVRLLQSRDEVFVSENRDLGAPLAAYFCKLDPGARRECLAELAELLSGLQKKRLHLPGLRPTDILVQNGSGSGRSYWLGESGPLAALGIWSPRRCFRRTVAELASGLGATLRGEERAFFFAACFDMALKRNIFSRPSQQDAFVRAVAAFADRLAGAS